MKLLSPHLFGSQKHFFSVNSSRSNCVAAQGWRVSPGLSLTEQTACCHCVWSVISHASSLSASYRGQSWIKWMTVFKNTVKTFMFFAFRHFLPCANQMTSGKLFKTQKQIISSNWITEHCTKLTSKCSGLCVRASFALSEKTSELGQPSGRSPWLRTRWPPHSSRNASPRFQTCS